MPAPAAASLPAPGATLAHMPRSQPRCPEPPCPGVRATPQGASDGAVSAAVFCAVSSRLECFVLIFWPRYRFPTEAALALIHAPCDLCTLPATLALGSGLRRVSPCPDLRLPPCRFPPVVGGGGPTSCRLVTGALLALSLLGATVLWPQVYWLEMPAVCGEQAPRAPSTRAGLRVRRALPPSTLSAV